MLFRAVPAVVALVALADPAFAEPSMRFSRMATRDLFALGRRDDDATTYTPTTTFCGMGTTCAEACGAGYEMCGRNPQQTRCFNPAVGETCCAEGLSCEKGYSCSAKGDMCLPGEAPSAPTAQYAAAAMTTASTASSAALATSSVLSSSGLATTASTSSPLAVLSVASSSASLSHASTEDCTQTTAVVVVPTPVSGNATVAQAGPTGGSASQTTLVHSSSSLSASATVSASVTVSASATAPSVVPANSANGNQGPVLAILLGAVGISALVL